MKDKKKIAKIAILLMIIVLFLVIPTIRDYEIPETLDDILYYCESIRYFVIIICIILLFPIVFKFNKTVTDKILFFLSFVPLLILLFNSIYSIFSGIEFLGRNVNFGIWTFFIVFFIGGFLMLPILIPCLIYQIIYSKRTGKKQEEVDI